MKVLVTGVKGQLGYDVCKVLAQRGIEHLGVDIKDFDITDVSATEKYIQNYAPPGTFYEQICFRADNSFVFFYVQKKS